LREFQDDPTGSIAAGAFITGECLTGRSEPVIGVARCAEDPLCYAGPNAASLDRLQPAIPCRFV